MVIDYIIECIYFVLFSNRRRHTSCALVTGVQTCALPILLPSEARDLFAEQRAAGAEARQHRYILATVHLVGDRRPEHAGAGGKRSEERRVGKECVSTCRSRWSSDH